MMNMHVSHRSKVGHRVIRKAALAHPIIQFPVQATGQITGSTPSAPTPGVWQRLWTALWFRPTLEQLYARQQREANFDYSSRVLPVAGQIVHMPASTFTSSRTHPAQSDLP